MYLCLCAYKRNYPRQTAGETGNNAHITFRLANLNIVLTFDYFIILEIYIFKFPSGRYRKWRLWRRHGQWVSIYFIIFFINWKIFLMFFLYLGYLKETSVWLITFNFCSEVPSRSLEDLLILLSPHFLSKPAQYLLQYLLAKHKIHRKHPETLFFASVPFYEFAIFNKIVECLPMREASTRLKFSLYND